MFILPSKPGVAIAVPNALDAPLAIAVDGWGGFFGFHAIITDIAGQLQGNVAWNPTALDLTYIYAFGDKLSQLSVAGLAFAESCQSPGSGSGLENVLNFYMANRLAVRAAPAQLHVGSGVGGYFQGFLAGLTFGISRPEARVAEFTLQYMVVPRLRGAW